MTILNLVFVFSWRILAHSPTQRDRTGRALDTRRDEPNSRGNILSLNSSPLLWFSTHSSILYTRIAHLSLPIAFLLPALVPRYHHNSRL